MSETSHLTIYKQIFARESYLKRNNAKRDEVEWVRYNFQYNFKIIFCQPVLSIMILNNVEQKKKMKKNVGEKEWDEKIAC